MVLKGYSFQILDYYIKNNIQINKHKNVNLLTVNTTYYLTIIFYYDTIDYNIIFNKIILFKKVTLVTNILLYLLKTAGKEKKNCFKEYVKVLVVRFKINIFKVHRSIIYVEVFSFYFITIMILRILLFDVKSTVMEKRSEYFIFIFYRKPVCEADSEMSV